LLAPYPPDSRWRRSIVVAQVPRARTVQVRDSSYPSSTRLMAETNSHKVRLEFRK